MEIISTSVNGVYEIHCKMLQDQRGVFVKTFHAGTFSSHGLETEFKESFYSVSKKNVLRGMHFQLSPYDHAKLVYVIDGEILDVALDIKKESKCFGQFFSTLLTSTNAKGLYMDKGFAHGFLTLTETATVVYHTTTVHAPDYDRGVRWDSFGFDWGTNKIILSQRDKTHPKLSEL